MLKTVILYVSFFLFVNKGWDSSLFSGRPSALCIWTNKNCFRMYASLLVYLTFVSINTSKFT